MRYSYRTGTITPFLQKFKKQLIIAVAAVFMASAAAMSLTASAATNYVITTDINTWDLSQTRANGHQEIISTGLRVWTDNNSSLAKAAAYYDAIDFDLDDATDWSLTWSGTTPPPGGQLVVDLDGDGDVDGILVVEDAYGGIGGMIWLPSLYNAATSNAGLVSQLPSEAGGGGYTYQGVLSAWNTNFPNAKVLAIGYSLGSGIFGEGIISLISVNDTDYTFRLPIVLASKDECKKGGWSTSESPVFANQGECVSHFASGGKSTDARNKNR